MTDCVTVPFACLLAITVLFACELGEAQTYTIRTIPVGNDSGGLAVDASGNFYVTDRSANVVRKVIPGGTSTVVAGDVHSNGGDYYGDGGPAVGAGLNQPYGIALDSAGNLYIADYGNNRLRQVSTSGIISTVAGGGSNVNPGGQATQAFVPGILATTVDAAGNLFIGTNSSPLGGPQVLKVAPNGIITAIAGGGTGLPPGNLGDGGQATSAVLSALESGTAVAVDAGGNLYIADSGFNRIRKVSTTGIITSVAGSNTANFSGDGGPAVNAGLNKPSGVAVDAGGNLYIADTGNYRIRKVAPDGTITTIAGNGRPGNSGDGGPATSATINNTTSVAVGPGGQIYFTDVSDTSGLVRVLTPNLVAPSITPGGIVPVFGTVPTITPGEWVSIFGTNLASGTTSWNGNFPVSLGGTSVTMNGKAAYLSFVSPGQINVQAPSDTATGAVPVVVTTAGGSATSTVTLAPFAPSFFLLDTRHVAGIILRANGSGAYGGGSYDIIGPTGRSLGYATVAAKAGDTIELFGTGFGPTNPSAPPGQAFSGAAPTTNTVGLLINNVSVTPTFVGLSGAGLYQINVTVPAGLGTGDVALQSSVGGVQTPAGVVISLQ